MLFGYIIFVVLPRKCTISIIFLTKISIHFGSSGFVGGFRRMRLSNREPVPRARSCRDRCRYRYICRPKRIQFPLRGRLKVISDSLDILLGLDPTYAC